MEPDRAVLPGPDQAVTASNTRSPAGQAAYAISLILVAVGLILMLTGNRPVGLVIGVIGFIGVVVLFFRKFTYRND